MAHTAEGVKRMDIGNNNYNTSGLQQPLTSILNNSSINFEPQNILFENGRMNSMHSYGPNELQQIHEMFPNFAGSPSSQNNSHNPNRNSMGFSVQRHADADVWDQDGTDPFKQSMW